MKLKLTLGVFLIFIMILRTQSNMTNNYDKLHGFHCFGSTKIPVAIRLNRNNDIECFSVDGRTCVSQLNSDQSCRYNISKHLINFRPVRCWGSQIITPGHWCNKAYKYFFKRWHCVKETGIKTGIRIDPKSGNPMCISFNGKDCIWGQYAEKICKRLTYCKITQAKLKPITCNKYRVKTVNNSSIERWCGRALAYFKFNRNIKPMTNDSKENRSISVPHNSRHSFRYPTRHRNTMNMSKGYKMHHTNRRTLRPSKRERNYNDQNISYDMNKNKLLAGSRWKNEMRRNHDSIDRNVRKKNTGNHQKMIVNQMQRRKWRSEWKRKKMPYLEEKINKNYKRNKNGNRKKGLRISIGYEKRRNEKPYKRKYNYDSRGRYLRDSNWSASNPNKLGNRRLFNKMGIRNGMNSRNYSKQTSIGIPNRNVNNSRQRRSDTKFLRNNSRRYLGDARWNSNPKKFNHVSYKNKNKIFKKVHWGSLRWRNHMKQKFGWNYMKTVKKWWGKKWRKNLKIYWKNYNRRRLTWNSRGRIFHYNSPNSGFNEIRIGSPKFKKIIHKKYGKNWKKVVKKKWGKIWKTQIKKYLKKFIPKTNKKNKKIYYGFHKKIDINSKIPFGGNRFLKLMKMKYGKKWKEVLYKRFGPKNWLENLKKYWKIRNSKIITFKNKARISGNRNMSNYNGRITGIRGPYKKYGQTKRNIYSSNPKGQFIRNSNFSNGKGQFIRNSNFSNGKGQFLRNSNFSNGNRRFIRNSNFLNGNRRSSENPDFPLNKNRKRVRWGSKTWLTKMRRKFGWNFHSKLKRKWGKSWKIELKIYWRRLNNRRKLPNKKGQFMDNSRRSSFQNIKFGSPKFKNIMNKKYGPNWKENFQRKFRKINWKKKVKSYWKRRIHRKYMWNSKGRFLSDNAPWSSYNDSQLGNRRFSKGINRRYGWKSRTEMRNNYANNNSIKLRNHWNRKNKRKYRWNSKGRFHSDNVPWSSYNDSQLGNRRFSKGINRRYGWKSRIEMRNNYANNNSMKLRNHWNRKNKRKYRWNSKGRYIDNSNFSTYKNVEFGSHKFKRIMQRNIGPNWINTLKKKWGRREWFPKLRNVWRNRNKKKLNWNNLGRVSSNSEGSDYKRKYCWDPKGKRYYNAKWTVINERTNIKKPNDCVIVRRNRNNVVELNYYRSIGNGNNNLSRFTVKK